MNNTQNSIQKIIYTVSKVINFAGMGILVVLMILTVADIFMRYCFSKPINGSVEITEYAMVILVYSGLAWCEVSGDILISIILTNPPPTKNSVSPR
jgi:TRAP-type C4-dicarboxylate transport system permease small subunit